MKLNQITVSVTDIPASIAFYQKLGLELIVEAAHYARFAAPGNMATFSVHVTGQASGSGTAVYFECDNLDETCRALTEKGLLFDTLPEEKPWLWREAWLKDPDGNQICLYFAGTNRLDPPWRVKTTPTV